MGYTKEQMAAWHQANRARRLPLIRKRKADHRAKMAAWIKEVKGSTPCTDCNIQYPYYVMQFDHLGDDKEVDIGDVVRRDWSQKRIQAEMDKCELVCANCHAERTHQRRQ